MIANIINFLNSYTGTGPDYDPVYILSGQSNALGQGALSSTIPSGLRGITNVFISVDGGSLKTLSAHESDTYAGMEYELGYLLNQYKNRNIYIIKYSIGGTRLMPISGSDWSTESTGEYYDNLKTYITNGLAAITALGKIPKVMSFIWYQGESDALANVLQTAYQTQLQELVDGIRNFLGYNINTQICRISTNAIDINMANAIRAAEQAVVTGNSNISLIDTDDAEYNAGDTIHKTINGQNLIGQRVYNNVKDIVR